MNKKKFKFKFNRSIFSLILREIKSILLSTTGLIVGTLFIFVLGVLIFGIAKITQFGTNDLTQVFSYLVFALAIAVPALVMGAISKEKNNGTLEYLLSKPLSELELLIAKFFSYSILSTLLILLTLPLTIITASYAGLDLGQVFMQYVGAIILSTCIVSLCIAVSALFKTEIASFLTSVVIVALFIIAGSSFVNFLPASLSALFDRISLLSHYQSLSRGVLDFRDLFYFVAFIFLSLAIAYYLLIKDKYPKSHKYLRNTKIATVMFIVIGVLIGVLGQIIPGRIDFTSDQRYTLSNATVSVINNIKDPLTIEYYASSNLPIEFQTQLRTVSDLLTDYSKASGGKITINSSQPDKDDAAKTAAEAAGITPIQFSVNSSDSTQTVVGYFGINFKYQDKKEALNFNTDVLSDLEYQVTKKVKKLTETNKKKLAFISNNVAHSTTTDLTKLNSELTDLFDIQQLSLTKDSSGIPSDVSAVIIDGPNATFDPAVIASLKSYYTNGGSIFLLTDTVDTNQQTPAVNKNSLGNLFEDAGVKVNDDLVYDLENNNVVALQSLLSPIIFNFPQWIVSKPLDGNTGITKDVNAVSLLWAGSITTTQKDGEVVTPLLETGAAANVQKEGKYTASFDTKWAPQDDDAVRTVAVALENSKGGRAVVVGDTDFLTDDIITALAQRQSQDKEVISFALNSISWLTRDSLVGSIKAKANSAKLLNLTSTQQITYVVVSIGVPILVCVTLFGVFVFSRRRLLKKVYIINE